MAQLNITRFYRRSDRNRSANRYSADQSCQPDKSVRSDAGHSEKHLQTPPDLSATGGLSGKVRRQDDGFLAREFRTENKLVNGFVQRQILSGAASHCGETSSIVAGLRYIVHAFTCYPQVPVISREGTVLMRIGARIMAMKEAAKF